MQVLGGSIRKGTSYIHTKITLKTDLKQDITEGFRILQMCNILTVKYAGYCKILGHYLNLSKSVTMLTQQKVRFSMSPFPSTEAHVQMKW